MNTENLLGPVSINRLTLRNRVAVAPMTRTSAFPDGRVSPQMVDYYASYARGGYALIITEGTYTDLAHSQGYHNQPGIATDDHARSWQPVVEAVHAQSTPIILQLMHAGALSQHNRLSRTVSSSGVQPKGEQMSFYAGSGPYAFPRALNTEEIHELRSTFAESALRALKAGFDGVEIHGANGYLLDQFLTSYTNERDDRYGGSVANRVRLTSEICVAVRAAVGHNFIVGVRISQAKVNDFDYQWENGEQDAETIFATLGKSRIDYIHTTQFEANAPAFKTGPSLATLARKHSGVTIIANGSLHDIKAARDIVVRGDADVISLGRAALANADWPNRLRDGTAFRSFDPAIIQPLATLANANKYFESLDSAARSKT